MCIRDSLHVGDTVKVLNHDFTICGIVEHGKGSRKFIPLDTLDQLEGNPGKASVFYMKTENTPQYQEDVRREILATDGLGDWSVQTIEAVSYTHLDVYKRQSQSCAAGSSGRGPSRSNRRWK